MRGKSDEQGNWTASVHEYLKATSTPDDVLRHELLLPSFVAFIGTVRGLRILDVGCGDGTLIKQLQSAGATMVGIDVSEEMLQKAAVTAPDVPIICHDITSPLPENLLLEPFDGITANMVFHCLKRFEVVPDLLAQCLKNKGWLAFSILHPAFHQSPMQISNLKRLSKEVRTWSFFVDAPYLEQREYQKPVADSSVIVTNYHRPIRDYVSALVKAGYVIDAMDEPLLTGAANQQSAYYHAALIPRFLFIRARLCRGKKGGCS